MEAPKVLKICPLAEWVNKHGKHSGGVRFDKGAFFFVPHHPAVPRTPAQIVGASEVNLQRKKNHRHVVAAKTVDYVECLICMPTKKMCTQKLAKDSNGFQPDLCSNSPFEKQLSATKKTMENSCNIQTDRILNGGILSLSVGFSTKFPHSSRMVSTTQNQKMDILHTHTKKSLVSTQQKHIHTANVKIAAYI